MKAGFGYFGIMLVLCIDLVSASEVTKPNEPGPWPSLQVNTFTGNLFYRRSDLQIPTRGAIPLEISFSYNSLQNQSDHGYGKGWSFSFGIWYSKSGTNVTVGREDGREDEFTWSGSAYVPPVGVYDALTEYATDHYLLTTKHGIKYFFEDPAHMQLTKIVDRNGNTITLNYSGGKPTVITDPSGRILNLTWTGSHLSQITDPNTTPPRTITFQYDGSWNTVQVTRPLSNIFHYGYDSYGYMTSVTDPRSVNVTISYDVNQGVHGINYPFLGWSKTFVYDTCDNTTTVSQVVNSVNRQTVYTFDSSGRVTEIVNADTTSVSYNWDSHNNLILYVNENGDSTSYSYDTKGNLLTETDCLGYTASFTYESTYNHPTGHTDKNGHTTTYSYDASGNCTVMVDCQSKTESYTYNSFGEMISATNKKGTATTYSYNTYGDLTGMTDVLGNSGTNTYDLVGNLLTLTDKRGYTTSLSYDLLNRHTGTVDALGHTSSYAYDANSNLTSETKPNGYVTTYSYDALNRRITKYSSLEGTATYAYDQAGNRKTETDGRGCTTQYTYDSRDRLTGILDPLGNTESISYSPAGKMLSSTDKNGNTTTYEYDCLDRLTKKTDPLGFFETYTYDAGGNLTSHTDRKSIVTTFTYDCLDRLTGTSFPLGYSETTTFDATGKKLTFTNKDGKTTIYSYDTLGRLTHVTDPMGFTESYAYDPAGNRTGSTDKKNYTTTYTYDNLGRLSSMTDPKGKTESYGYDADGNRTSLTNKRSNTTTYAYDGLDRLIQKTDPLGYSESYAYDQVGNQTSYTDKNGNISSMAYNCLNRRTSKTDPYGFSDLFGYDPAGHMISHTDRNGHVTLYAFSCCRLTGITDPLGYTESYGYDPNGNRTSVTDKNGHITLSIFDNLNRLSTVISPMGHQTQYTYNGAGSILTKTDANLNTTTNAYNARNQLITTSYPDVTTMSYSYDNEGNLLQTTNTGGIGDITTFTYDSLHRVISKVTNYGTFSKTISFTYDNNGNRTSITTGSGTITYLYDNDDRDTSITDQDSKKTTFFYDGSGNQVKIRHPNGLYTYNTYDAVYNLKIIEVLPMDRIIDMKTNPIINNRNGDSILPKSPLFTVDYGVINQNTDGGINQSFTYTYDHVGNKTSEMHEDSSMVIFQYNNRNQLIHEATLPSGNLNLYSYTPTGRRASKTVNGIPTIYSYNNDDVLIAAGGTNYVPDNNGNRIIKNGPGGTTQYSYGYRNELKHVILPDLNYVDYKYSSFGTQLAKNENGTMTYFQSNRQELLSTYNNTGIPVSFFNPGLTIHHAGIKGYYYYNGFESSTLQVDTVPAVLATARFDAFGNIVNSTGTWLDDRKLFASLSFQDSVGLYTDGFGLFYDETTGTNINGTTGEKIKNQTVAEPGPTKPPEMVGDQQSDDKKKQKCCGVKKFEVTWSIKDDPKAKRDLFRLDVLIEFMDDDTHDPACCEYCQFVSTVANGTDAKGGKWRVPEERGKRHDDGYSRRGKDENGRSFDYDGHPEMSDPGFETNDNPGGVGRDETIENYTFTADQAVIEICPKPCPTGETVAKNGPHTATVTGKYPYKHTFDGKDWKAGDTKP
jgi:YD repeat-containing protein